MCKCCNEKMSFGNEAIFSNNEYDIFVVRNVIKILNEITKSSYDIKIKYCPMCGKELIEG